MIGMRAEPFAYGAPEYVDMELFLMWRARGMTIETPGGAAMKLMMRTVAYANRANTTVHRLSSRGCVRFGRPHVKNGVATIRPEKTGRVPYNAKVRAKRPKGQQIR